MIKPYEMIVDFVTGRSVPDVGAEANRQLVERFLVDQKGYAKADIRPDVSICFEVAGQEYRSCIDLVVSTDGGSTSVMVIRCAAGSLGSYERETLAAARILEPRPIPFAVVSDGRSAMVIDAIAGRRVGRELGAIPEKSAVARHGFPSAPAALDEKRIERERLIFRSYDAMRVNAAQHLPPGRDPITG